MFGRQFYHESLRKIVVAFGTIFNNIVIVSPSTHTINNDLFEGLDGGTKFSSFSHDVIDKVAELSEKEVGEAETNYVLLKTNMHLNCFEIYD